MGGVSGGLMGDMFFVKICNVVPDRAKEPSVIRDWIGCPLGAAYYHVYYLLCRRSDMAVLYEEI